MIARFPTISRFLTWPTLLAVLVMASLILPSRANAQSGSAQVIKPVYFNAFRDLDRGDYKRAFKGFKSAAKSGYRVGDRRWIDSICYYTMMGEVHFQMGDHAQALEQFNAAAQLYIDNSSWMIRVRFDSNIQPRQVTNRTPPWGNSTRRFRLGHYRETHPVTRGEIEVTQAGGNNIIRRNDKDLPLHVEEVVRCICLSIRRRTEILGPTSKYDPLTQELLETAISKRGPVNHWSNVWLDLILGIAYASTEKLPQAKTHLDRSLVAGGEYDHALTSLAMLELGKVSLRQKNLADAARYFEEASYSAFYYTNPYVLEEACRHGTVVAILSQHKEPYPLLLGAMPYARRENYRLLQARLGILLAENYAALGNSNLAQKSLNEVRLNRDMSSAAIGAHYQYVLALTAFQLSQVKAGETALAEALKYQRDHSVRRYQVVLVDGAFANGVIRPQVAIDLYQQVLADPAADLWRYEPLEAITRLLMPQTRSMQRWFEAALAREDMATAIEVADLARRRRYFATLPLGGRLASLRHLTQAPANRLSADQRGQRQDLTTRYPRIKELNKLVAEAVETSSSLAAADDADSKRQQDDALKRIAQLGQEQEKLLRGLALRREPAALGFPPQRTLGEIQKKLGLRQAILTFFATDRHLYGFLITSSRVGTWKVVSKGTIERKLSGMLRAMGHFDGNRPVDVESLADDSWRVASRALHDQLMAGSKIDLSEGIDDLVIVPDGSLWYLPFEALLIGKRNDLKQLLETMTVRYAPTVGLAVNDGQPRARASSVGVVLGELFPKQHESLTPDSYVRLQEINPKMFAIDRNDLAAAAPFAKSLGGLVVLDDIDPSFEDPYGTELLSSPRSRGSAQLRHWFASPWGGPETVILPGLHTPAENGLKRKIKGRAGDDLFLTLCGLMSTGCRTALVSRWRVGGQISHQLVEEFLLELPDTTAQDAWQRSVQIAQETTVDFELEPRVRAGRDPENLSAAHPFFWSGYLVVDTVLPPGGDDVSGDKK